MKRLVLLRHAKSSLVGREARRSRAAARRPSAARRAAVWPSSSRRAAWRSISSLCSSALRAQQTLAQVEKRVEPRFGVRVTRDLYMPTREQLVRDASSRCLRRPTPCSWWVTTPSLEALALALANRGDPSLRARLMEKTPTASLCVLELAGQFSEKAGGLRGIEGTLSTLRHAQGPGGRPARDTRPAQSRRDRADPQGACPEQRPQRLRVELRAGAGKRGRCAARAGLEYVHQMRVGVRRLRTALQLFQGCSPSH